MLVVLDANELFSLIIKGSAKSKAIFLSDNLQFIVPEFLLIEFSKNESEILKKSHRNSEEFRELLSVIEERVLSVSEEEFKRFIPKAQKLLPEHPKDVPYLALALRYNCPVWSQDKTLKKQTSIKILDTDELYNKLAKRELA